MSAAEAADPAPVTDPPVTTDAGVDAALAGLADLAEHPLATQLERLTRAHEALHAALDQPSGEPR